MKSLGTLKDVAERLGVSCQRAASLIRLGVLPRGIAVRLGRQVRVDLDRLEVWIEGGGQDLPGGWRRDHPADRCKPIVALQKKK